MRVFAISDLLLGSRGGYLGLLGHPDRLIEKWGALINNEDVVLIPGNVSAGASIEVVRDHYEWLDQLPGRKIISPGDRDSVGWADEMDIDDLCNGLSLEPLKESVIRLEPPDTQGQGLVIGATMGSLFPQHPWFKAEEHGHFMQSFDRCENIISQLMGFRRAGDLSILMMHYQAVGTRSNPHSLFSEFISTAEIDCCVFGHMTKTSSADGESWKRFWSQWYEGKIKKTRYYLVSAEYLQLQPQLIAEWNKRWKLVPASKMEKIKLPADVPE